MRSLILVIAALTSACIAPARPATVAEHMASEFGISLAEAERRAAHQDSLHALVARAGSDPGWAGLRIEHVPIYRIVLRFTDGRQRAELIALAPADLRPHIAFEAAARSRSDAERVMTQLSIALQPLGGDWNISYDEARDRFAVSVGKRAQVDAARRLIPLELRTITDVAVGPQIIPT